MNLVKSKVIFDPIAHAYSLDGEMLSGITSVISKQLFPNKYSNVPDNVLKKAAERGTAIHSICELIDDLKISHDSEEAKGYQSLKQSYSLQYECSEYLVSDNEHYASCIDKVFRENETDFTLGDIKTTYVLDKESLRWQLSIYAYLFEMQNPECKAIRLIGIWLRGNNHEIVEVERIPNDVIKDLLFCDANGLKFDNPYLYPHSDRSGLPAKYQEMEQSIIEIEEQAKYWADKRKELTEGVMKEMVKAGEYSWKGESISFTRKKDSIREDFDKKAFKKDHPDVYKKYLKETPVVGSVTLKIS